MSSLFIKPRIASSNSANDNNYSNSPHHQSQQLIWNLDKVKDECINHQKRHIDSGFSFDNIKKLCFNNEFFQRNLTFIIKSLNLHKNFIFLDHRLEIKI
ncbi:hypothetical protein BpHYR1_001109 [Brachionus plicatilis]|uniref:Uncharacterized protein n=1 Tax=Brachionus plicatilis TaxID=10195 RepID=A0A3M7S7T4_BRAPC|nr:hypothetical protein BpHYR1_001109 [Brachionus plicatilis]